LNYFELPIGSIRVLSLFLIDPLSFLP
jgi:hypothetical protein